MYPLLQIYISWLKCWNNVAFHRPSDCVGHGLPCCADSLGNLHALYTQNNVHTMYMHYTRQVYSRPAVAGQKKQGICTPLPAPVEVPSAKSSDERFRSNCRYHDFFPFLGSRCNVTDMNDNGLIMEWLLNLVVDCFRSFRPCFAEGRILARRVPRTCMPLPQSSSCDVMCLGTQ